MELIRVLKNFNVLNCILIIVFFVFLFGFLLPRLDSDVVYVPTLIKKKPVEKNPNESLKTQSPSPQEYRVIADQNLFHPERIIPPEQKAEDLLPKPEFVLFGTLISPDLKVAYLEDKKAPVSTPGRGKRQTALMLGESLSGFKLKEIMTDKIVMTRGDEILQVLLQEPGSAKARETTSVRRPSVPGPLHRLLLLSFPSRQGLDRQFPFPGKDLGLAVCLCLPDRCTGFPACRAGNTTPHA